MMDESILTKETIVTDLALIKSCLRIINQTITLSKEKGKNFDASGNAEFHKLTLKIDRNLCQIKMNVGWKLMCRIGAFFIFHK